MSVEEYLRSFSTKRLERIIQHVLQYDDVYDSKEVVVLILDILSEREGAPRYDIKPYVIREAEKFVAKYSELFEDDKEETEGQ